MARFVGYTKDEAIKRKRKLDAEHGWHEPDVWGRSQHYTVAQAHEWMYDRLPDLQEFTIPRQVLERLDLSMQAKIIYGVLAAFPRARRWRYSEISGLTGICSQHVALGLALLEERGLMERERYKQWNGRLPSKYKLTPEPTRFVPGTPPRFLTSDISNIEEELKERFIFHDGETSEAE